jgi:hypothetical protein
MTFPDVIIAACLLGVAGACRLQPSWLKYAWFTLAGGWYLAARAYETRYPLTWTSRGDSKVGTWPSHWYTWLGIVTAVLLLCSLIAEGFYQRAKSRTVTT